MTDAQIILLFLFVIVTQAIGVILTLRRAFFDKTRKDDKWTGGERAIAIYSIPGLFFCLPIILWLIMTIVAPDRTAIDSNTGRVLIKREDGHLYYQKNGMWYREDWH